MFAASRGDRTKSGSLLHTTDEESLIRTDEETEDLEDNRWNSSSKLWAYVNR